MKNIFLILCLLVISFVSSWAIDGKMLLHPLTASQKAPPKPKYSFVPSQVQTNDPNQKLIYLRNIIQWDCLKRNNRIRSEYRRPIEVIKLSEMSQLRNEGSNRQSLNLQKFSNRRQNSLRSNLPMRRGYFGKPRIIYLPPHSNFVQKRVNSSRDTNKIIQNKNFNIESLKIINSQPEDHIKTRENKRGENIGPRKEKNEGKIQLFEEKESKIEKSRIFSNNISTETNKNSPKLSSTPSGLNTAHPQRSHSHFWYRPKPSSIKPYEVREIIEEQISFDIKENEYNNKTYLSTDANITTRKEIESDYEKPESSNDLIKESITAVLKSLITPMTTQPHLTEQMKKELPAVKYQNHLEPSTRLESNSPQFFPAFLNDRSPSLTKEQRENKAKQLTFIPTEGFYRLNEKLSETSTQDLAQEGENENNVTQDFTVEYKKNVQTTDLLQQTSEKYADSSYMPSALLKTEQNLYLADLTTTTDSQHRIALKETDILESSSDRDFVFSDIDLSKIIRNLITDQKTKTIFSTPTTITNDLTTTARESSSIQPIVRQSPNEPSVILSKAAKTILTTPDSTKPTEYYTDISVQESDLTPRDFQEFTDHPMTFDLLTTFKTEWKNDQDSKNSRKMHFKENPEQNTILIQPKEDESAEQRRSDILINENSGDYIDVDNNLSNLKYLETLKLNYWNSTIDTIAPYIPLIINDLRESKIPPEDIKLLSETFGKYWTTFLILVNKTNIDMLPLMKITNEEDLKNVLLSVSPETYELSTIKTTEESKTNNKNNEDEITKQQNNEYDSYDYLQEYKDFYQDILQEELEEEKKRKKTRTKRNEEDRFEKSMEATEEYFNSLAEENRNYYDNAVFDEAGENQRSLIFEIIAEVSDYKINVANKSDMMR